MAAGVPRETRKLLLGHASGDFTTHYSAAEIKELIDAVDKIADRGLAQTPTLTLISVASCTEMHNKAGLIPAKVRQWGVIGCGLTGHFMSGIANYGHTFI